MAIKVMSNVWDLSTQKQSSLLVMLALGDRSDEEGVCWPGYKYLGRKARVTRHSAMKIVQTCVDAGELIIAERGGGRKQTNHYLITLGFDKAHLVEVLIDRFKWNPEAAEAEVDRALSLLDQNRDVDDGENGNGGLGATINRMDAQNGVPQTTIKDDTNSVPQNTINSQNGVPAATVISRNGVLGDTKRCSGGHPIRKDTLKHERKDTHARARPHVNGDGASVASSPSSNKDQTQHDQLEEMLFAVFEVCAIDVDLASDRKINQCKLTAGKLHKAGKSPDLVRGFTWWGDGPPSPGVLRDEFGAYEHKLNGAKTVTDNGGAGFRPTDNVEDKEKLRAALEAMNKNHKVRPYDGDLPEPPSPQEPKRYQPTNEEKQEKSETDFKTKREKALAQLAAIAQQKNMRLEGAT